DPDLVPVDAVVVADLSEVLREEVHQMLDLLARPPQILGGEREHGEDADADLETPFEDLLELVPTLHVAVEDVPEADFPLEPAVAVHDHRHATGDRGLSDWVEQPTFVR